MSDITIHKGNLVSDLVVWSEDDIYPAPRVCQFICIHILFLLFYYRWAYMYIYGETKLQNQNLWLLICCVTDQFWTQNYFTGSDLTPRFELNRLGNPVMCIGSYRYNRRSSTGPKRSVLKRELAKRLFQLTKMWSLVLNIFTIIRSYAALVA